MKVLKSLAVIAAVLLTGACKTAPDGNPLDSGLNNAIGGLGSTAGLTRYNYSETDVYDGGKSKYSDALFINTADPKEIKEARSAVVDGKYEDGGKTYQFNNKLFSESSIIYGKVTLEAAPAGITADGYKFYKTECTQSKGRQYLPATDAYQQVDDFADNIGVGRSYYFAIKDEGSQIIVIAFDDRLPTDQNGFDVRSKLIYKK